MQALGMTDGFFTVLLMGGCKAVRFLLDSKNWSFIIGVWWNADTRASSPRAERRPGSHPGIPTS